MAVLKRGSSGPEVEDLQRQLSRLGYAPGPVDGKFGSGTRSAVIAFQESRGLTADGVVGKNTRAELKKALAEFAGERRGDGRIPAEDVMVNRSLRLSPNQYYQARHTKDLIVLHHTAGGSVGSTFSWWQRTPQHIATAFIVERDGMIYEVFDPREWAYHLGLKGTRGAVDRRSIGIEIASEGGLKEAEGQLYKFDRISNGTRFTGEAYDHGRAWRGYRHFAAYTPEQISSVVVLTNHLLEQFDIARQTPKNHLDFDQNLLGFRGVVGHHHLRVDKSDLHPGFDWQTLVRECSLGKV